MIKFSEYSPRNFRLLLQCLEYGDELKLLKGSDLQGTFIKSQVFSGSLLERIYFYNTQSTIVFNYNDILNFIEKHSVDYFEILTTSYDVYKYLSR